MDKHINCLIKHPTTTAPCIKKNDLYIIEQPVRMRVKRIIVTSHTVQYNCLLKLYQTIAFDEMQTYISEIKNKLNGYKHQDREKKRSIDNIISYDDVIVKLITSHMQCYYCNCNVNILYSNVKQENQWTLERINNDIGHTNGNCEVCCLRCNLKRRCIPSYLYKNSKKIGKIVKLGD